MFSDPDPQLAQTDVSFSSGPEYFSSIKAPNPEGSISTRSDSKRSSVNQNCTEVPFSRDFAFLLLLEMAGVWSLAHIGNPAPLLTLFQPVGQMYVSCTSSHPRFNFATKHLREAITDCSR
ncbi:hypothetical protein LQV05_004911 [Cryptococcus neoformans]|nr:hypothetical protein LQV05_004911 [Cryptococcus neoformans]